MSIRERLDTLSRGELAGLGVVLVVSLVGAGLWYTRSLPRPVTIAETPGAGAAVAATASGPAPGSVAAVGPGSLGAPTVSGSTTISPPGAPMIVDVTGLVRKPGVYEFPAGSRVIDAVERAGGAKEGADLSLLNLAAPLADGQQIVVPKEGNGVPGVGASTVPGSVPSAAAGALININTASAVELEELSGIGEVLAAAVVAYRDEHGPFTSVDQLEDVSGIGPSTLEEIRDQVTV
jgi:competence protein ComEA